MAIMLPTPIPPTAAPELFILTPSFFVAVYITGKYYTVNIFFGMPAIRFLWTFFGLLHFSPDDFHIIETA
jgi:hypothetical protein